MRNQSKITSKIICGENIFFNIISFIRSFDFSSSEIVEIFSEKGRRRSTGILKC